jgi:hypothetical protein
MGGSIPEKGNIHPFPETSIPFLGPTQPSIPQVHSSRGVNFTIQLHVVHLKNEWKYASDPPCRAQGQLHIFIYFFGKGRNLKASQA